MRDLVLKLVDGFLAGR